MKSIVFFSRVRHRMPKAKDPRKARRNTIRKRKNTVLRKTGVDALFIVKVDQHCTIYKPADRVDQLQAHLNPVGMSSRYHVNQSLRLFLSIQVKEVPQQRYADNTDRDEEKLANC